MLALDFIVLIGRAAYVQVFDNAFFSARARCSSRTLELPASHCRILDRNGLLLASSVVAPNIWAIPKDVERAIRQAARNWRACWACRWPI